MSLNSFGHVFRVTTWGESHGPALGATVDGCPPGVPIDEAALQRWLDLRKPGQNKYTTQRREPDAVRILSGIKFPAEEAEPMSSASKKASNAAQARWRRQAARGAS